jgi:hypothetical protein
VVSKPRLFTYIEKDSSSDLVMEIEVVSMSRFITDIEMVSKSGLKISHTKTQLQSEYKLSLADLE